MQIINLIIGSIVQIILFSAIPFIWWIIKKRKEVNFFQWIGLKRPIVKDRNRYIISFLITMTLLTSLLFIIPLFIESSDTATSQFAGQGLSALIPALIYSFVQTGLSEEILFRGFLTKILVNRLGFKSGNTIQGIVFGLLHGIMFVSIIGISKAIVIVFITGAIGMLMGWINEKQSEGSIISSWLLHGFSNTIAAIITMFNIW